MLNIVVGVGDFREDGDIVFIFWMFFLVDKLINERINKMVVNGDKCCERK